MICEICGAIIENRDKSQANRNKHNFCSRSCYELWWKDNVWGKGNKNPKWKPKTTIICMCCGNDFEVRPYRASTAKFCSHSCRAKYNFSGDKNPLWKGGVTATNDKARKSDIYKTWRSAVYKRDRWICQKCGYKGRQIIAHHVKKFSDYPNLRYEVSNGITLCRTCHVSIENPQRLHAEPLVIG